MFKDKRLPAVPPCLMQNAFSLQSANTLLARYACVASQLLESFILSASYITAVSSSTFFHIAL